MNQLQQPKPSLCDVLIWPDGEWCFRHELEAFPHRGDDFLTVAEHTCGFFAFIDEFDCNGAAFLAYRDAHAH